MNDSGGQPPPRVVTEGDERPLGACSPFELTTLSAADVARTPVKLPGPVTLQDRQGVFVHSFRCSICDLEFVVFSWRANRHWVGSTFCPECGERTPMLHWRAQASSSLEFCSDGPGLEIYQMCPPLDAFLMDDFVMPADDRYTFPDNNDSRTRGPGIADDDAEGGLGECRSTPKATQFSCVSTAIESSQRGVAMGCSSIFLTTGRCIRRSMHSWLLAFASCLSHNARPYGRRVRGDDRPDRWRSHETAGPSTVTPSP